MRIPIPELLIRLREEQFSAPHPHPALRGQGAGYSAWEAAIWRWWARVYGSPRAYRAVSWLTSRLRALTPRRQGGWTRAREPIVPAPRRLRDLLQAREATGQQPMEKGKNASLNSLSNPTGSSGR